HSDRERQRHSSSDRERGRLQQNAQTETNIGEEIMPATNKPDSTRNFFVLASGPEFESRLPEGRFTGESRLFQVRGTLLDVEGDLLVHARVKLRTLRHRSRLLLTPGAGKDHLHGGGQPIPALGLIVKTALTCLG